MYIGGRAMFGSFGIICRGVADRVADVTLAAVVDRVAVGVFDQVLHEAPAHDVDGLAVAEPERAMRLGPAGLWKRVHVVAPNFNMARVEHAHSEYVVVGDDRAAAHVERVEKGALDIGRHSVPSIAGASHIEFAFRHGVKGERHRVGRALLAAEREELLDDQSPVLEIGRAPIGQVGMLMQSWPGLDLAPVMNTSPSTENRSCSSDPRSRRHWPGHRGPHPSRAGNMKPPGTEEAIRRRVRSWGRSTRSRERRQ